MIKSETVLTDVVNAPAFQLDGWIVYPARNLIRWTGTGTVLERQLEPRLMRLLCLLASAADSVATREHITESLWPNVIVNENSLTRAVSDLRRLLLVPGAETGTRKADALIETVPKRGYRLSVIPQLIATPAPVRQSPLAAAAPIHQHSGAGQMANLQGLQRWAPSITACLILIVAVVVQIAGGQPSPDTSALLARLGDAGSPGQQDETRTAAGTTHNQSLDPATLNEWQDRVLPSLNQIDANHPWNTLNGTAQPASISALGTADSNMLQALRTSPSALTSGQSMLTPDGQIMAYVDYRDGISSLTLRPALAAGEPWVAFTTDEHIYHLQWSPLDAGILLTVGQDSDGKDRPAYLRLMLLDLDTLALHELYRREIPAGDDWLHSTGNLS